MSFRIRLVPILALASAVAVGACVLSDSSGRGSGEVGVAPAMEVVLVTDVSDAREDALREFGEVWGVDRDRDAHVVYVTAGGREALEAEGFDVQTDAVRSRSLERFRRVDRAAWRAADREGVPGYACYRTVTETHRDMDALADEYPRLARVERIGESWQHDSSGGEAGDTIRALVVGRADSPHHQAPMMVIAAQHARELTTAEIATRFAERLVESYDTDPTARWLLDHREIHVVPQLNPDGRRQVEQTGDLWRKNENTNACPDAGFWGATGVDLNRNHAAHFGRGVASADPCDQTYHGADAGSEPESRAIEGYMDEVFDRQRPADDETPAPADAEGVFISLHSFSELVLVPWDGKGRGVANGAPNHHQLMVLGRKLGFYTGYETGRPADILYAAGGTTTDYAYKNFGVAAFTPEIGTDFFQSCEAFESGILADNLASLTYAAKAAAKPYTAAWGPEVLEVTARVDGDAVHLEGVADDGRFAPPLSGAVVENPAHGVATVTASFDVPPHLTDETFELAVDADGFSATFSGAAPLANELYDTDRLVFVSATDAEGHTGVPAAAFVLPADGQPAP